MIRDISSWLYCIFHPCSYYEKLIITACYESLTDTEEEQLQKHVTKCKKCNEQYHQIFSFTRQISQSYEILYSGEVEDNINLIPQIMSSISEQNRSAFSNLQPMLKLSMGFVTVLIVSTLVFGFYYANHRLYISENKSIKTSEYEGPLEHQKEKLREIIKTKAGQTIAGQALLMLADLEYTSSQRYEEAYHLYTQLRQDYPRIFSSSQEAVDRYNLLKETKSENFKPLYALNSALSNRDNPIRELESIVSKYPGTMVANLAMSYMIECFVDPQNQTPEKQIKALENLRGYLREPSAVAQVNYAIGNLYGNQMKDIERARIYLQTVAHSETKPLHYMANDALSQLVSYSE